MKIAPRIQQQKPRVDGESITLPDRRIPKDPFAAIDKAYNEITAPRADMSKLIVDPRPEHANPLLRQEVEALRMRVQLNQQSDPIAKSRVTSKPQRDTVVETTGKQAPGLFDRQGSLAAMLSKGYVIGRGYRGAEVAELKQLMANHGLHISEGVVFDDQTHEEIQRFQRHYDIKPTGIVDNATYTALKR